MYTFLFFDDQKLFGRDGLTRCCGSPVLTPDAIYKDGVCATPFSGAWVLPLRL